MRSAETDPHEGCRQKIEDLQRALDASERVNLELQQALTELERAAGTDRLTGAWNRRRFEESAAMEMALARRRKGPVSLLMLDLDHFKHVNDRHGHNVGDQVLVETTRLVREHMRASDALARWGGEEFLVMAPATRLEGALNLAEKIRQGVESHTFPVAGHLTVSIGVAAYTPGMTLESWINAADEALYRAKKQGRNQVLPAEPQEGEDHAISLLEIVWEERYECGEPTIDAQHHQLFTLANALFAATTTQQPQGEISLRLSALAAHAAQHFRDEEALLARAGYPDLAVHGRIHEALLLKMIQLQKESEQGQLEIGRLVEFFISDIIQGHLLAEDQKFFPCFRKG